MRRARISVLSVQPDRPQPSIPETDSTLPHFGNGLPKTPPLPEQKKLPNPVPANSTSDENEDELIPCPYDSRISYERIWGTNVPVTDYDIFKLHHPFSMLVAGPRGAGKRVCKATLVLEMFHHDESSRQNCLVLWSTSTRPVLFFDTRNTLHRVLQRTSYKY